MLKFIQDFIDDRGGATAMEYAMIAGLLSIVIIAAVATVGGTAAGMFQSANSALTAPAP